MSLNVTGRENVINVFHSNIIVVDFNVPNSFHKKIIEIPRPRNIDNKYAAKKLSGLFN